MNWHELLLPAYWQPMAECGGGAFLLFLLVWWRRRDESSAWTLAAIGAAWMASHVAVSIFSYLIPPKQPVDWLMTGSAELSLTALLASWKRWPGPVVSVFTAASLVAASWLALRQMPFLLERTETPVHRQLSTAAALGGLLLIFLSAEWSARQVTPAAFLIGMAVFALLTALSLWRMVSPQNTIVRPLAAASLCAGASLAACLRWSQARLTPGAAGWLAGGIVVLFVFGCLSRVSDVPLRSISVAAGVIPASAVAAFLCRRLFRAGQSFALIAALLAGGTVVFAWSGKMEEKSGAAASLETGADDTGAYD